jgi:arabinan endo-1,5-alpha-L-arabinosidase
MLHPTSPLTKVLVGVIALSVSLTTVIAQVPTFSNVTVHDPSVVRSGSQFYVFGSHLASARTSDWMHWTQISSEPNASNPLVPNPQTHFAAAIAWVGGNNAFWAPDVIQLGDGRYYYYYCIGRLDQPRAVLGVAVADSITGPYTDRGIILRSGMWGLPSEDGSIYDPTRHPNAVDPDLFFDQVGKLWMVYGSYSGGIFILQMDTATGLPLPNQGYGKKLIGGHHARIEGAFMLYSPESAYYYLFLSFGGLDANGGYNIRVARSRQPDGPFLDSAGRDLTNASGTPGTLFDDLAIAPYGVKLMGSHQFMPVAGEPSLTTQGYVSPGHNSAYYDPATGQHFLVFHTRFVGRGEEHQVRVHQLYMNADEWLVAAPHRYAGETLQRYGKESIPGAYKIINHGKAITPAVQQSRIITLRANGSITGAETGSWQLMNDNDITLTLNGTTYRGVMGTQWNEDHGAWVHAFTAISGDGAALWGSRVVLGKEIPVVVPLPDRLALYGHTMTLAMPKPRDNPKDVYSYLIGHGPAGVSIDRATGLFSWRPTLTQLDVAFPVTVIATNTSAADPRQTHYAFTLTARSANVVRRVNLDFNTAASAGILDGSGQFTGFTSRLPGTGSALPAQDPKLRLDTTDGVLELATSQSDFNGQAGLPAASAPGIALADLGFTGTEDFSVNVVFRPLLTLQFIDQVGLYIGSHSNLLTRADTIVFGAPEFHSAHTQNGFDYDGRFFGFGLNAADGLIITIGREGGVWRYVIDGREWNPQSAPTFLDGRADLVAGVFAVTPLNNTPKTIEVDSFSMVVATDEPLMTALEAWRVLHFARIENEGAGADTADPDLDGRTNLQEFEGGTDPLDATSH